MLLDLFNVGLVYEVAWHCNGVLQVLNLVRASSRYKEEVSGYKVDTEFWNSHLHEFGNWDLHFVYILELTYNEAGNSIQMVEFWKQGP